MELHQMHCGNTLEVYMVLFAFSWMCVCVCAFAFVQVTQMRRMRMQRRMARWRLDRAKHIWVTWLSGRCIRPAKNDEVLMLLLLLPPSVVDASLLVSSLRCVLHCCASIVGLLCASSSHWVCWLLSLCFRSWKHSCRIYCGRCYSATLS